MSEWIRIRVKDFYKDAVGELEYTYVTREVYEHLSIRSAKKPTHRKCGISDIRPRTDIQREKRKIWWS